MDMVQCVTKEHISANNRCDVTYIFTTQLQHLTVADLVFHKGGFLVQCQIIEATPTSGQHCSLLVAVGLHNHVCSLIWDTPTNVFMIAQAILTTYIPNNGMAISSFLAVYE